MKRILLIAALVSCKQHHVNVGELTLADGKYRSSDDTAGFSGRAIGRYENNQVSGWTTIVDGVPRGECVSLGYDGEIIQKGSFRPIQVDLHLPFPIYRINLLTF